MEIQAATKISEFGAFGQVVVCKHSLVRLALGHLIGR